MGDVDESGNSVPRLTALVAERIDQLLKELGRDKSVLVTNRSWKTLQRYAAGTEPPLSVAQALTEAAGKPLGWVAGEAGNSSDIRLIPRLDIQAAAGAGALVEAEDAHESVGFRADWLREHGINPLATAVLTARGDSMEPTIRDGDFLLVDTSINDIVDNAIYVIVLAGRTLVKRLQVLRSGAVVIKSDNPVFREEVVPPEEVWEIQVAGRVMWFGRSI